MAGHTTLDSSPGIAFRSHQYLKNIETANLGYYYSKSLENLNYIIVDCIAKPAIDRAPEWTYNNRVVDSIKTHRTLSLTIAGAIAISLFIIVVYFAHPSRADTKPIIPDGDPKAGETPESAPPGPDGTKPGEPPPSTDSKKPEGAKDPSKTNGAEHEKAEPIDDAPEAEDKNGSNAGGSSEKKLAEADVASQDKEKKKESDPNPAQPSSASSPKHPLVPLPRPSSASPGAGRGAPKSSGSPISTHTHHPRAAGRGAPNPDGSPSGSSPPIGDAEEFDFSAMVVKEDPLTPPGATKIHAPGAKKNLDTLEQNRASGASTASGDADPTVDEGLEAAMEVLLASESAGGSSPSSPNPDKVEEVPKGASFILGVADPNDFISPPSKTGTTAAGATEEKTSS